MIEKVKFTRSKAVWLSVACAVGIIWTTLYLYFVKQESLSYSVLVAVSSFTLLALCSYTAYIVCLKPETKFYLGLLRIISISCFGMGILTSIDFVLPNTIYEGKVEYKRSRGDTHHIHFGKYWEDVHLKVYKELREGDRVKLEITPLFAEIDTIISLENGNVRFDRGTIDELAMQIMGLAFLVFPMALFLFAPRSGSKYNILIYFTIIMPNIILSVVSIALWIKFLMVHVFHTVSKM